LDLSPNGSYLFVTGEQSLAVFQRNSADGTLSFIDSYNDDKYGVDSLDGASSVATVADNVYVTSDWDDALNIFGQYADDRDGDNIPDDRDNCPDIANPLQENFDNDSEGDLCDLDDDNDGIPDDVEEANGLNPKNPDDAADDSDGDGASNREEYDAGTNFGQPDVRLVLSAGTNLVSLPVALIPLRTSYDLIRELGGNVIRISRLNPDTGEMETATRGIGPVPAASLLAEAGLLAPLADPDPQGVDFPIVPDQAYFIDALADDQPYLSGAVPNDSIDLVQGFNLAGFYRIAPGTSAYDLLVHVGGEDTISSISRLIPDTGRYETVIYNNGLPNGPDFPIQRGVGYIFTMHLDKPGIPLP
jgi:hypothetical protein